MRFSLIVSAIGLAIVGIAQAANVVVDLTSVRPGFKNQQHSVEANVEDTIELMLKENLTTGYAWLILASPPSNENQVVKL